MDSKELFKGLVVLLQGGIEAACKASGMPEKGSPAFQRMCEEVRFRLRPEEALAMDAAIDELLAEYQKEEGK